MKSSSMSDGFCFYALRTGFQKQYYVVNQISAQHSGFEKKKHEARNLEISTDLIVWRSFFSKTPVLNMNANVVKL